MSGDGCPFCTVAVERVFHAGRLVIGLWDGYPVSPGHALLVPRRHVATWFEATDDERRELADAVGVARDAILRAYQPDGFNIGVNVGAAGGQTVFHLHVHVIPRYRGDVKDPRGGVRHVIPGEGLYRALEPVPGTVSDTAHAWVPAGPPVVSRARPRAAVQTESAAEAAAATSIADATAFGERVLQLLDEGRRTSTYKYAVLLALTDLCVEIGPSSTAATITTRQLAERVLELYWPQTAPYDGQKGAVVLAQNQGGQAEIVSAIRRFRERAGADASEPLSHVRVQTPRLYDQLVRTVQWKLIEMPLPRLQVLGDAQVGFLYRIGWDASVRRQDVERNDFDDRIHLLPGVADHLVRLSGLLRPLIQQAWAAMVVKMNRDASDEARLQEFLFGARRIALDPVRQDLRELQDNRCFYCERPIHGAAEVDHFIPWARHPDNGIDNLVVADGPCNNSKRDFLAAAEHVTRWAARLSSADAQLADIAERAGWETHRQRTLNTARTLYLRLPGDVRLWLRRSQFVPAGADRSRLVHSLDLGAI